MDRTRTAFSLAQRVDREALLAARSHAVNCFLPAAQQVQRDLRTFEAGPKRFGVKASDILDNLSANWQWLDDTTPLGQFDPDLHVVWTIANAGRHPPIRLFDRRHDLAIDALGDAAFAVGTFLTCLPTLHFHQKASFSYVRCRLRRDRPFRRFLAIDFVALSQRLDREFAFADRWLRREQWFPTTTPGDGASLKPTWESASNPPAASDAPLPPGPQTKRTKPRWDAKAGILQVGDRSVQISSNAKSQRKVLDAFHAAKWRRTIESPFPSNPSAHGNVIHRLNQRRFLPFTSASQGTMISWNFGRETQK